MKPYEKYKDSGIDWIGEIPEHWKVGKVKQLFKVGRGRVISTEDVNEKGKYPVFSSQTRDNGCIGYIDTYDYDYEQLTWTTDGANAGTIFLRNGKYNCTNVCGTLQLNNEKKYFLKYMYYFLDYVTLFYKRRDTNGFKIMNNEMKNIEVIAPYFSEQQQIANYLDKKTVEIDSVISDLELQLEKLETYRRELIFKAVTKGINQNIKMKDSGIDWIGEAPEHWEVVKIKWMFEIVKRIYGLGDRDVLSITQNGIKIKNIDENVGQMAESYDKYQIVNINDFAMNSMDLLTGWVDCSKFEGVTSPDYRVFKFVENKVQCHAYYTYFFQLCYTNRIFYRLGQGVSNLGRWRLQAEQFLNMYLPKPNFKEQQQIATYLDNKSDQINTLKIDIMKQIDNLKNYRKILIRDAVTGKINVAKVE
ncbi:restriction endonuclease subunit S [Gemella haemolysans]|uniref:restriction endonuclease subunit S n=1 Tax=Gemella haemolysans TaxID=1379 RepID=UPI0028D450F9|nr:restriction endonuclease subunit S [Gemella haemolysans]